MRAIWREKHIVNDKKLHKQGTYGSSGVAVEDGNWTPVKNSQENKQCEKRRHHGLRKFGVVSSLSQR